MNIPINPSQQTVDQQLQQTLLVISSLSETNILNYTTLTDMKMSAAMKFLGKLLTIAHLENPALLSFIFLSMVQISISFGLSPSSLFAFASFGSLVAKSGKVELGGLFTMWAKSLSKKLGSKEVAGEVICGCRSTKFCSHNNDSNCSQWQYIDAILQLCSTHAECNSKVRASACKAIGDYILHKYI
jgi:hypothetical protein